MKYEQKNIETPKKLEKSEKMAEKINTNFKYIIFINLKKRF